MKCEFCNKEFTSALTLFRHFKAKHFSGEELEQRKEKWVLKNKYGGIKPTCGCGCGSEMWLVRATEFGTYINGHWMTKHTTGKTWTEEQKKRQSNILKNSSKFREAIDSEEYRKKQSDSHKGKTWSEERKAQLSMDMKKFFREHPESIKKIKESGRKKLDENGKRTDITEAGREKMRQSAINRWKNKKT